MFKGPNDDGGAPMGPNAQGEASMSDKTANKVSNKLDESNKLKNKPQGKPQDKPLDKSDDKPQDKKSSSPQRSSTDDLSHAKHARISMPGLIKLFVKKELKLTYRYPIILTVELVLIIICFLSFFGANRFVLGMIKDVRKALDAVDPLTKIKSDVFKLRCSSDVFCNENSTKAHSDVHTTKTEYILNLLIPEDTDLKYGKNYFADQSFYLDDQYKEAYKSSLDYLNNTDKYLEEYYTLDAIMVQLNTHNIDITILFQALYFLLIFLLAIFLITKTMQEKENSIHGYMIIMGLPRYCYYSCYFFVATVQVWFVSVLLGFFIISLEGVGPAMFVALLLFAHYTMYMGLMISTIFGRSTYAVLVFILLMMAQLVMILLVPFGSYDIVPTTALMFIFPIYALKVINFNLNIMASYNLPMHYFSDFNFYIPIGPAYIALVWHILIIVLLTYYLDYVFPVDNTQKLHPLFFLGFHKKVYMPSEEESSDKKNSQNEEPVPPSAKPGIAAKNVCKRWSNGEVAVNHVSFVALKNQVTGLLGHNGAGKSTLFGCLTGLYKPTSGEITVDADESVGYCPQWDPIFPRLTVREHLHFYGTLKTGHNVTREESDEIIKAVGLQGSEKVYAKNLSGGQKRKLCVGMAIIGGSKIVLLDEPTAGMDPMARHSMIGIIEGLQEGRTVLITTHYMDEAESVADRVIILSKGEIMCSGSIDFLKSKYSTGFVLTIVFSNQKMSSVEANTLANKILDLVKREHSEAAINGSVGLQFTIHLPPNVQRSLPRIFTVLEENKEKLMIDTFGINVNSLEEVFLKVSEQADPETSKNTATSVADVLENISDERGGLSNFFFQIMAMIVRRFHYSRRHYLLTLVPYIIVLLLVILALTPLGNIIAGAKDNANAVIDSVKNGPEMTILLYKPPGFQNVALMNGLKKYFDYPNVHFEEFFHANQTFELLYKSLITYPPLAFMIQLDDVDTNMTIYANGAFELAPLVFIEAFTNTAKKQHSIQTGQPTFTITTTLNITNKSTDSQKGEKLLGVLNFFLIYIITWPVLLYSYESQGTRHLYRLAKLTTPMYWFSSCIAEMFFDLPILIILFVIAYSKGVYSVGDIAIACPAYLLYLVVYITEMFCFSKLIESGRLAFTIILTYNILGIVAIFIIEFVQAILTQEILFYNIRYLFPSITLKAKGASEFLSLHPDTTETTAFPHYDKFYISLATSNVYDNVISAMIYVIILAIISFISANAGRIFKLCGGTKEPSVRQNHIDVDKEEKKIVEADEKIENEYAVTAVHLRKIYFGIFCSRKIAVHDLTIGITPGECFGLLGANGAGKSTTFSMLTGCSTPTAGNAFVNGQDLSSFSSSPEFGFCPQTNNVLDELSVDETFYLFSRLSGRAKTKLCVDAIVDILKLEHVRKHKVKSCSGGEKRRVSVGVALLTNPDIIMLDEPTAGIDPRTRRRVWDLLIALRDHGSSEVLSSHSMEECETLCTRVGFLSQGVLRAIGTCQHLKHAFSDKYVLKIIVSNTNAISQISQAVIDRFPGTELTDTSNATLTYSVPKGADKPYSKIYAELITFVDEQNGTADGLIKDYNLVDASLEQVFIATTSNNKK